MHGRINPSHESSQFSFQNKTELGKWRHALDLDWCFWITANLWQLKGSRLGIRKSDICSISVPWFARSSKMGLTRSFKIEFQGSEIFTLSETHLIIIKITHNNSGQQKAGNITYCPFKQAGFSGFLWPLVLYWVLSVCEDWHPPNFFSVWIIGATLGKNECVRQSQHCIHILPQIVSVGQTWKLNRCKTQHNMCHRGPKRRFWHKMAILPQFDEEVTYPTFLVCFYQSHRSINLLSPCQIVGYLKRGGVCSNLLYSEVSQHLFCKPLSTSVSLS